MSMIVVIPEYYSDEQVWNLVKGFSCSNRTIICNRTQYSVAKKAGYRYCVAVKMA